MSFDGADFWGISSKSGQTVATVTRGPVKKVLGVERQGAHLDDIGAAFELPVSISPDALEEVTIGGWFFPMSTYVPNTVDVSDARITVMTNGIDRPESGRSIILQRSSNGQTYWALVQPGFILVSDIVAKPYKWALVTASFSAKHGVAMISVNGESKQEQILDLLDFSSKQGTSVYVGGTQSMEPSEAGFYGVVDNIFVYSSYIRSEQVSAIFGSVGSPSVLSPAATSAGYGLQFASHRSSKAWVQHLPPQFQCLHDFHVALSFRPDGGDSSTTQGVFALGDFEGRHTTLAARHLPESKSAQLSMEFHGITMAPIVWIPETHIPVGHWTHLWLSWNGSQLALAYNHSRIETWTRALAVLPEFKAVGCNQFNSSSLLLGAVPVNSTLSTRFLNGAIDELRVQHQGQEPAANLQTALHSNSSSLLSHRSDHGLHFRFNEGFGQSAEAECTLTGTECGSVWLDLSGGAQLQLSHETAEARIVGSPPEWIHSRALWDDWFNATEDIVHEFALNASVVHALQPGEPHLLLTKLPMQSKVVRASETPPGITTFNGIRHRSCPVLLLEGAWHSLPALKAGDTVLPGELLCYVPPADTSPLSESLQYKVSLRNQTVLSTTPGTVSFVVNPVVDGYKMSRSNTVRVTLSGFTVHDPDENDAIQYTVES